MFNTTYVVHDKIMLPKLFFSSPPSILLQRSSRLVFHFHLDSPHPLEHTHHQHHCHYELIFSFQLFNFQSRSLNGFERYNMLELIIFPYIHAILNCLEMTK
jgi:hypothetical protein